jgi:hypothetical protein
MHLLLFQDPSSNLHLIDRPKTVAQNYRIVLDLSRIAFEVTIRRYGQSGRAKSIHENV